MSVLMLLSGLAAADPCGMVPPISIGPGNPGIERIGAQRTYVMHHAGIETIALRPGFSGDVEEFGMLIPFPSPPALRKIDDDTFAHIEAAVDPPQVNVWVRERYYYERFDMAMAGAPMAESEAMDDEGGLRLNEVRVVNEEAVGMYQVAVLEAGSTKALKKWMGDNEYRFPDGMEAVTSDYVSEGWFFVAIKAKVGQGAGVKPRPGMRQTNSALPAGASFDGHVQGMAFRFASDVPVVPMRLSVFNGEDPRNVVYMLTDEPVRIDDVPDATVVRQVPGEVLHGNLTNPLPVVVQQGKLAQISSGDRSSLDAARDPSPYSHIARDLFASDLLSIRSGQMSLPHEETEKQLLSISEAFGMRGVEIDALHAGVIEEQRAVAVDGALDDLREMHMTVLDGVFPQEVLARQNLTFSPWRMPKAKNVRRVDAIRAPDLQLYYTKQRG